MGFLREQPHKFALQILSALFSTPQWSIHDALKRQQRLADDADLRTDELCESSGPNARLTHSEDRAIIDWGGSAQRVGDCASPCEVRGDTSRPLSEGSREGISLGKPWWRSVR
jgi:hypothetical protein